MNSRFTYVDFLQRYPDENACLDEIWDRVYGDLENCPDCERQAKYHRVSGRKCYECQHCGHQLYPLAKTPLKDTKLPLMHWFFAIMLFSQSKNGVSGKELQRTLGVSYPTAWRMGHKIREMMNENGEIFLTEYVEIDETLVGGKQRGGKRGWGSDKPCVFGMVERGGQIKTVVVENRKASTLMPIIVDSVDEEAICFTDEFKGYNKLHREVGLHLKIQHKAYQWVDGEVHTQTIDGHWSILKRSIRGTHVAVSRKWLQSYLNEFDFKRNHRYENMFDAILAGGTRKQA